MNTVSFIKNEFNELKSMPFFWGRLICFSILFALDELTVTHFESPYLYYFIIALAVFFVPSVVMQALALDRAGVKLKLTAPLFWWLVLGGIATVNEVSYGLINGTTPIYLASVFCFFIPVLALCGKEKGFYKLFMLSLGGPILFNIISGFVLFPLVCNIYSLGVAGFVPLLLFGVYVTSKRKSYLASFVLLALYISSVFLTYISMGRTGFFSSLIILPVFIIIAAIAERAEKKEIEYTESRLTIASFSFVILFSVLISSALIYICSLPEIAWVDWIQKEPETMLEKIFFSIKNNTVLSSRASIWKYTFENISIIGNGPFFYMGDLDFWHAHNSFLAVLAHYGVVPFILYCLFFIWAFATSIKYCFKGKIFRFFPFIMIFTYFIASMTEDLACIVVPRMFAVLFYFVCALLINEYPKNLKKRKDNEL